MDKVGPCCTEIREKKKDARGGKDVKSEKRPKEEELLPEERGRTPRSNAGTR
jgi:hypothetical protein